MKSSSETETDDFDKDVVSVGLSGTVYIKNCKQFKTECMWQGKVSGTYPPHTNKGVKNVLNGATQS